MGPDEQFDSRYPGLGGREWIVRIAILRHLQKTLPKVFMDPRKLEERADGTTSRNQEDNPGHGQMEYKNRTVRFSQQSINYVQSTA